MVRIVMFRAKVILSADNEGYIIRDETGEIFGKLEHLEALPEIETILLIPKREEIYQKEHKAQIRKRYSEFNTSFTNYGKLNLEAIHTISKLNLTAIQLKVFLLLASHTSYVNCIIKKGKRYNMTRKFIAKELGISMASTNSAVKKLEKEEIIKVVKEKKKEKMYFNPYI
ncbi:MAG: hypothetical protein K2L48_04815, partial [Mycoplasmoidaceae bacterium]|nr:hypothetical protein [Mycoplasmoidaceae bacterium]